MGQSPPRHPGQSPTEEPSLNNLLQVPFALQCDILTSRGEWDLVSSGLSCHHTRVTLKCLDFSRVFGRLLACPGVSYSR